MDAREPGESSAVPSEPEEVWSEFSPEGCSVATSLTITAHGRSGTGEEDKSFNPRFYHIRKGGAWTIQKSLESKSVLGKVYKCPCPSGTQISATFNSLYGFSDDVKKAQYLRGDDGKKESKYGKASTYIASQLSEYMVRNMPKLETQEAIDFEASLTKANGMKMMTCHLQARMTKTSEASKETFGQQLRPIRDEKSAKLDSRNATFTGRSIGGTESLIGGMDTVDEQDKEFWELAIGNDD